eukprot:PhM_4_TR12689/c0_g1_i1/m.17147
MFRRGLLYLQAAGSVSGSNLGGTSTSGNAPAPGKADPPSITLRTNPNIFTKSPVGIEKLTNERKCQYTSRLEDDDIFLSEYPFNQYMYKYTIRQKRMPTEYGRTSRPGTKAGSAREVFPHTYLSVARPKSQRPK